MCVCELSVSRCLLVCAWVRLRLRMRERGRRYECKNVRV